MSVLTIITIEVEVASFWHSAGFVALICQITLIIKYYWLYKAAPGLFPSSFVVEWKIERCKQFHLSCAGGDD